MKTSVIMISGKQGSGKSSLQHAIASSIDNVAGNYSIRFNFADILYEMHDAVLEVLHWYYPKRPIIKDGPLLQVLGTEWGRQTIEPDIWVKCLKKKMLARQRVHADPYKTTNHLFFIIGDLRFQNEFYAFPDEGFPHVYKIRLEAPEHIRKARCSMWRENTNHPSEVALDAHAEEFEFDLYLDTENNSIQECVQMTQAHFKFF